MKSTPEQKRVTILLPNYKTPVLTKLCVRLLRKYTPADLYHLIAIDNHSQDESSEYLKSLPFCEFIECKPSPEDGTALSHSLALDAGLARVTTPYVLSIHTDTLVNHPQWLPYLIDKIEQAPDIAGVGSWKMEQKTPMQKILKSAEGLWQRFYYPLIGKQNHRVVGMGDNAPYLRSHCALYRTVLLKEHHLSFADGVVAGKGLHKKLIDLNYRMNFLPTPELSQYLNHINHATIILNPALGGRKKTITKGLKRVKKQLNQLNAQTVLADASLDI